MDSMVFDMPMSDYRAAAGVSATTLKNMQRSPAYAKLSPSKDSAAKAWGSAVHTAVLEPAMLKVRYGLDPEHPDGGYPAGWRNTKDYKAQREEHLKMREGLLTREEWDDLGRIVESVSNHEIGAQLYEIEGFREVSIFAPDPETRLTRKIRPDWLIPSAHMIVDVKTCRDHRPGPFARACKQYGYHMSAAYYLDTANDVLPVDHFVLLAINAEAPFEVAAYTLDRDSIEQGRKEYREALAKYAACKRADDWPGGSSRIEEIRLPDWSIDYYKTEGEDRW